MLRSSSVKRHLLALSLAIVVSATSISQSEAQEKAQTEEPMQHEFGIRNFKTESGAVLPEARIVYGTYGQLNAAGDNAVLLPSHYMADMHGYGWLGGPGKAPQPKKLVFIPRE